MSTATQYNPQVDLNKQLLDIGLSKTVYALVTPETEAIKAKVFGDAGTVDREEYLSQFREAWTGKQDAYHEEFFSKWQDWSAPVVDLDRVNFPFYYPTAGASEPLRQIIFDVAANSTFHRPTFVHVFKGEYEGYKAMAEAAGLHVIEHDRADWREVGGRVSATGERGLFFISQPSAIDGNVWEHFNDFVKTVPHNSLVADVTYVGAVPQKAIKERFNLNTPSIRNVVFSLSKPFGCYYDRIGGVFSREEDLGLFGNKWFKNLTSLRIGTKLMETYGVFRYPEFYVVEQNFLIRNAQSKLGLNFNASDVFILATGESDESTPLTDYLRRAGKLRVCLTPGMALQIEADSDRKQVLRDGARNPYSSQGSG